jgi:hypothetical protein
MNLLSDYAQLVSGTPQFRIQETADTSAPSYSFYGQPEVESDLAGTTIAGKRKKQVRTFDRVSAVEAGDVLFSLISGKSTVVSKSHSGYLFTQNYVKLIPSDQIDKRYLVYLINEDKSIGRQLQSRQQGSITLKYTIKQLEDLAFPNLPPLERQVIIGELYFNQLRLAALKTRAATTETTFVLERIREATNHE